MSAADNGLAGQGTEPDATLNELREKLSELREHLRQAAAALGEQREGEPAARGGSRGVIAGRRFYRFGNESGLRCYSCGRARPSEQSGWTLRLCGDDELHPFCPDCDRRNVSAEGEERPAEVDAAPAAG